MWTAIAQMVEAVANVIIEFVKGESSGFKAEDENRKEKFRTYIESRDAADNVNVTLIIFTSVVVLLILYKVLMARKGK